MSGTVPTAAPAILHCRSDDVSLSVVMVKDTICQSKTFFTNSGIKSRKLLTVPFCRNCLALPEYLVVKDSA